MDISSLIVLPEVVPPFVTYSEFNIVLTVAAFTFCFMLIVAVSAAPSEYKILIDPFHSLISWFPLRANCEVDVDVFPSEYFVLVDVATEPDKVLSLFEFVFVYISYEISADEVEDPIIKAMV